MLGTFRAMLKICKVLGLGCRKPLLSFFYPVHPAIGRIELHRPIHTWTAASEQRVYPLCGLFESSRSHQPWESTQERGRGADSESAPEVGAGTVSVARSGPWPAASFRLESTPCGSRHRLAECLLFGVDFLRYFVLGGDRQTPLISVHQESVYFAVELNRFAVSLSAPTPG